MDEFAKKKKKKTKPTRFYRRKVKTKRMATTVQPFRMPRATGWTSIWKVAVHDTLHLSVSLLNQSSLDQFSHKNLCALDLHEIPMSLTVSDIRQTRE
jgi:hypothetical protein